jgi:hypothetical protein
MNRRSILTKTGKGLMEATGKTSNLSRDLRNILKEIDGKVSVSELLEKFERMGEPKLLEALSSMEREGYLREFVGKQQDDTPRPSLGRGPASDLLGDGSDLDFTAFTPAKPNAKANENARLQAQAQEIARQAQATRAREEAAAKARAETAARVKADADPKARQADAAKPAAPTPYVGILGAGPDAHARAQTDALDRARREADERQRKEAEEKARQEAEARAKLEIELAIKRDAEERARKEIQERIRREDEERARREAEARAKAEAEQRAKREAEERIRREMEERARREIEERIRREEAERLRREEEERARREVERRARIDAEAKAKVEAELRARREGEERARRAVEAEVRARREAAERARREAEEAAALERTVKEEQEKAQAEAEERAQREEEERREREEGPILEGEEEEQRREEEEKRAKEEERRARQEEKEQAKAASKLRKAERARERAGEEAWRGDDEALRDPNAASLSAAEVWEKRRPRSLAKTLAIMLLLILIVGLAALPFVPLETAAYEKAAQAWLGQPVKIGSMNLTLLPLPRLKFEKVVIGRDPQMRVAVVRASPELASLLEDRIVLRSLELENATLPREFLAALLQDKGGRRALGVERVTAKGLRIDAPELNLPPLDLEAGLSQDGALRSVSLSNADSRLAVKLEPRGGRVAIEISAGALPLPIGIDFGLNDFQAKGTVSRGEVALSSVEGRAFGGRLFGNARLRWSSGWSLDGEISARQMDAAKVAGPLLGTGTLQGKAVFSMRGLLPERMVLNSQIEGSFTIQKGTISNVDMTRLLQGSGSSGGTTPFTEMSGTFSADPNRLLVRQVKLAAGLLSGAGQLEMDPQKNLSGRMQIELRAQSVQARANLAIAGTLTNPQFRRSN